MTNTLASHDITADHVVLTDELRSKLSVPEQVKAGLCFVYWQGDDSNKIDRVSFYVKCLHCDQLRHIATCPVERVTAQSNYRIRYDDQQFNGELEVMDHIIERGHLSLVNILRHDEPDSRRRLVPVRVAANIQPSSDTARPQYMRTGETSLAIQAIGRVMSDIALAGSGSLPGVSSDDWIDDWDRGLRELAWWLERYQAIVDEHVRHSMQIDSAYIELRRQQATLTEFVNPDHFTLEDIRRIADEQIHHDHLKALALVAPAEEVDRS